MTRHTSGENKIDSEKGAKVLPATHLRTMSKKEEFQERKPPISASTSDKAKQTANSLICQLTLLEARFRVLESRIFLRNRSVFGVASTYSSEEIYSRTRSRDIRCGGAN